MYGLTGSLVAVRPASADGASEPVHALKHALAGARGAALDVPLAALDLLQLEALRDLAHRQRLHHVLLVGQHQERNTAQLVLGEQMREFLLGGLGVAVDDGAHEALLVGRVEHEDEAVDVLEVVAPQGADDVLREQRR